MIKLDYIDSDLFLNKFSEFDKQLFNKTHCDILNSLNPDADFFKSPIEFSPILLEKSKISKEISEITDLYPVNICVIDFIIKNFKHSEINLLDFGCGIPNLLHHLSLIGYKNLYGYDNWMHIEKKYVDEFSLNTGLEKAMIDFEEIFFKDIKMISHIGFPLSELQYKKILSIPTLEYILADYRFTPAPELPEEFSNLTPFEDKVMIVDNKMKKVPESIIRGFGFEPFVIYDGLLLIYKKQKK